MVIGIRLLLALIGAGLVGIVAPAPAPGRVAAPVAASVAAGPGRCLAEGWNLVQEATSDRQWTGIAVAGDGRVFVCFPRWSPDVPVSVALLTRGEPVPYPDREWNCWNAGDEADLDPSRRFVCVQSVHVDARDRLWILDPASPMFQGVVPGGAKLLEVDLAADRVVRTIVFPPHIAPPASYLNDVRVDVATETAYLTDSGEGALVIVDLASGAMTRRLAGHPATRADGIEVVVDGRRFDRPVHADGIALDAVGGWLYFQPLTSRTLRRLPLVALRDTGLDDEALAARITEVADSGVADGLLYAYGGVLLSALEAGEVRHVSPGGYMVTLVRDPRVSWPDSFALGPDGSVWFTTSQIHLGRKPVTPYRVLRLIPASAR
ncbi:MAG: L-dopachrome tautomerase-related protein [Candidatus Krumholzibacteriia bacterium]